MTVDCGSAKSADCLGIFNHDLFTGGCTVEVRGSTDNFAASDVLVHSYTPSANTPFIRDFTAVSYRYWRLRITGSSAPTLTIVAIGAGLEFPVRLPYGFDPLSRKAFGQMNISEEGLPLGKSTMFEQWAQQLNFQHVENTWLRATFLPAWKAHLRDKPFLFAFDLSNYAGEIYLVASDGDYKSPTSLPLRSNLQFSIKGIALP
ncbi:MAG TPA: hypothetical protein DCK83_00450 [Gallionellaceae bacterium]|nr:hypothetical protein [Gallionellaceae bacterium]